MSDNVILQVKNVTKWFSGNKRFWKKKKVQVLNNVSFEINRGETVALVGESGSGKSTTARLILNLDQPGEGEILFKGQNIHQLSKRGLMDIRKNIQIVFQDPYSSVNSRMTVRNIISEPLLNYGYPKKKVRERVGNLLKMVGLDQKDMQKYPHQFSGGQLQRIGIARAIALDPEFIVLDEPTSALDVSVQARILKLLKELQRKFNLTYMFITHDLNVVETFADRVLVMRKGEIVESGTVQEIFHSPKQEYTRLLLDSNLLEKHREELKRKENSIV